MKRQSPSVTFQEPPPATSDEPVTARMRYSQLLKSLTGGSMISGQSSDTSPTDKMRRAFDSSALPAKPAMKRPLHRTLSSEYPAVQEGVEQLIAVRQEPNPATGATLQTRGGAALASALGEQDIPPACPPPPPPTSRQWAAAHLEEEAADAGRLALNSLVMPKPLTAHLSQQIQDSAAAHTPAGSNNSSLTGQPDEVDDLSLLDQGAGSHQFAAQHARVSSTAVAAWYGSPAFSGDAPHVTVQLAQATAAAGKMRYMPPSYEEAEDVSDTAQQLRDQGLDPTADSWQQAYCQTNGPTAAAAPAAGAVTDDDGNGDDTDSTGAIIPPGHQDPLPTFSKQLTVRALVAGLIVGFVFVLLTMRLLLVTSTAPNLQVVLAGSCWVLLKTYSCLFGRDMQCIPVLAAQEVAVAASAALAVASSAAAGGFGTVLLAIQDPIAQRVGSSVPGNLPSIVWSLDYWKLVCYLLIVGVAGAMLMLSFRKLLLARPCMTFATGAAAGQLINTLHTPPMSYHGHKQMHRFAQWSAISFLFSGYQWVFNNPACNGFIRFPTFGLQALSYTWNFDFQLPYVGLGILAPVSVAWSMVVGGVLTWGLLWPVFTSKEGSWFPRGLAADDVRGTYGYHLVAAMALLLADALYHAIKGIVGYMSDRKLVSRCRSQDPAGVSGEAGDQQKDPKQLAGDWGVELGPGLKRRGTTSRRRAALDCEALRIIETDTLSDASTLQFGMAAMERALRQHIFMADSAISWAGIAGFVLLMGAAIAALPNLFGLATGVAVGGASRNAAAAASSLMYYHVLVAAILSAVIALASARGAGVTNINVADAYTKLGILIFSAWAGSGVSSTGTGLLCGGLLCGVATSAVNAMYAWRAGFMVMASPTAVFASHMIGLVFGCLFAPLAWLLFYSVTPISGVSADSLFASDGFFSSPLAAVFRTTAVLAGSGLSALPLYAVWVGLGAVVVAFVLNVVRDVLPVQARGLVPIPAAIGVVCLSGAAVAVDLAVGAVARIVWRLRYPRSADAYALVVGCALIAGEGLWGLGQGLLAAFGQQGPICMSFSLAPAA